MNKEALTKFFANYGCVVCKDGMQTEEVCNILSDMFNCPIGSGYIRNFHRYLCPTVSGLNCSGYKVSVEGNISPYNSQKTITYEDFIFSVSCGDCSVNALDIL